MKFTTPCFVRVEDAEKRKELTEWLQGIGYYVYSCCLFDGWNTLHCRGIDRLKIAYEVHGICDYDEETRYSIDQFKAENAAKEYSAIDCGEDIELFKALAAMNDENDREQWFVRDDYAPVKVFKKCAERYSDEDFIIGVWMNYHKATAEEIVEYFKNNEK